MEYELDFVPSFANCWQFGVAINPLFTSPVEVVTSDIWRSHACLFFFRFKQQALKFNAIFTSYLLFITKEDAIPNY